MSWQGLIGVILIRQGPHPSVRAVCLALALRWVTVVGAYTPVLTGRRLSPWGSEPDGTGGRRDTQGSMGSGTEGPAALSQVSVARSSSGSRSSTCPTWHASA